MKIIYNKIFLEHDTGMHPENKKRLISLGKLPEMKIDNPNKNLQLVHTKEYIDKVKKACRKGEYLDPDTATSNRSYEAAVCAVGATIMASKTNGFALVRPPGHHAYPDHSSGFCIFNNIAVAVQRLANEGKKVLIFDFDGHLGDGTVKYFYNTDKVLYWSLHQYPAFPGGGTEDEIGKGRGKGFTVNIPLPPGSGDDVFLDGVNRLMGVARQFNPDVVAVSAGFDGHKDDLLLDLGLSANIYHKLGQLLTKNFKNVFATLEGGYNTIVFPKCVYNFLDGINRKPLRFREEETETRIQERDEYESRISRLERNLSDYWRI
ncbi:MAG: histone deacetylase [Nanoarchaeota archaeon]